MYTIEHHGRYFVILIDDDGVLREVFSDPSLKVCRDVMRTLRKEQAED